MQAPSGEFAFTRLEKVIFGPGKVAELGPELERRGLSRAVIATGKSLDASPLLERVKDATGGRCVGVFSGTAQHAPAASVRALTSEIERLNADAVVSFGGGSAIDSAKVAIASAINGRDMIAEARGLDRSSMFAEAEGGRQIAHIAVPTTLSAGEYTSGGGVTDEATHVKRGVFDPRLQAKTIIHDPELTTATPDWLWAATGMRALDHAIEAIYSVRHQPFVDALAEKAIKLLMAHLVPSLRTEGEARIAHRGHCQLAAWFSLFGGLNTGLGISHALGHQIGPMWDVPHGITSCITLPHAMRLVAGIAPQRFGPIADGLGIAFDARAPEAAALACAERVASLIASLGVAHTLKAVGVVHNELPRIADAVRHEIEAFEVADRPITLNEVQSLLEAAYGRD